MKYLLLFTMAFTAVAKPQSPQMSYDYEAGTWVHVEKVSPDTAYVRDQDTMELKPMIIMEETPTEIWLIDENLEDIKVYTKEN